MAEGAPRWLDRWKSRARELKRDTYALYLAYHDPRVAWPAKMFVALLVAYALSPIDLIPDFVPVLGYLDDLVILPLGISLAVKLIPADVLEESRAEAVRRLAETKPRSWAGAAVIVIIWCVLAAWFARLLVSWIG